MLLVDGEEYYPQLYSKEEDLEKLVEINSKKIFGENSIYLNLKPKIKSQGGIGSIPDGYVFTVSKPYKWYIIEAELAGHPIYEHIVSQLNKFIIGIKSLDSRRRLVKTFYDFIKSDKAQEEWLKERIDSGEIHKFLTDLIDEQPSIVIIIDQNTAELEDALSEITLPKRIIEFERYANKNGNKFIYRFEPLYNYTKLIGNGVNAEEQAEKIKDYESQFFIDAQTSLPTESLAIVRDIYDFSKSTSDKIVWGFNIKHTIGSFSPYYLKGGKILEPFTLYSDGRIKIYLDYGKRILSKEKYDKFIENLVTMDNQIEKSLKIKTPTFTINSLFLNRKEKLDKFKETVIELR